MNFFSPNDSPVQNDSSSIKNNNFGGNRATTTGKQQKDHDYTSSVGGSVNIKKNPVDDTTKDIDDMANSEARKREFSRRAETQDPADHNKERCHEASSDNRPLEDTDVTIIPDDKHIRSKLKGHFGEGQYEGEIS